MRNITIKFLFLILFIFLQIFNSCQPWELEKRYDHYFNLFGYNENDTCYGIFESGDEGYLLIGKKAHPSLPSTTIVKINNSGDLIGLNSIGNDEFKQQEVVNLVKINDGFLLLGNTLTLQKNWQITLAKLDLSGNFVKGKNIGTKYEDKAFGMTANSLLGYFILGYTFNNSTDRNDYETIIYEIDQNFELQRQFIYNFENRTNDYGCGILKSSDGNYIILALSINTLEQKGNLHLVKLSKDNIEEIVWDVIAVRDAEERYCSIIETVEGNYIVAYGSASSYTINLVMIESEGKIGWQKVLDNSNPITGITIAPASDNDYLVLAGPELLRTDESGTIRWRKKFEGNYYGTNSLIQTKNNNGETNGYIIAGTYYNKKKKADDFIVFFIDNDGNMILP